MPGAPGGGNVVGGPVPLPHLYGIDSPVHNDDPKQEAGAPPATLPDVIQKFVDIIANIAYNYYVRKETFGCLLGEGKPLIKPASLYQLVIGGAVSPVSVSRLLACCARGYACGLRKSATTIAR